MCVYFWVYISTVLENSNTCYAIIILITGDLGSSVKLIGRMLNDNCNYFVESKIKIAWQDSAVSIIEITRMGDLSWTKLLQA